MNDEEAKSLSRFVLDRVADRYMSIWEKKIDSELRSTKNIYKRSIRYEYVDDFTVVFILDGIGDGRLPMMIEQGIGAFDIKDGFRTSAKAHNSGQPNWYLTVPMKHATAEAIAESSVFSGQLAADVQSISRAKQGPLTLTDLPTQYQEKGVRLAITSKDRGWPAYQHKSAKFEGLVHQTTQHHQGYYTFRRVSEKSDDNSWIHKGVEEHDLMGKALEELGSEISNLVAAAKDEFLEVMV